MKKSTLISLLILVFTAILNPSIASADDASVEKYISIFQKGDYEEEKDACNELQWSGLSDTRLFDIIENKFKAIDPAVQDKYIIDLAAYYLKALASSGQSKYSDTLLQAASSGHKKIRRHASISYTNLGLYNRWNPIISKPSTSDPTASNAATRFHNMIMSDEWELRRIASKRIYHDRVYDEELLQALNQQTLAVYKLVVSDRDQIDTLNWMMKALAGSKKQEFRQTLEEIAADGHHSKNKRYAASYITKYLD